MCPETYPAASCRDQAGRCVSRSINANKRGVDITIFGSFPHAHLLHYPSSVVA